MTLPFDLDWRSFWIGVAVVAVPGFLFFMYTVWTPASPFRPQAVVQLTKRTPWQVVMAWLGSKLVLVGLGSALAAAGIATFLGTTLTELLWLIAVAAVSFVVGLFLRVLYG